ncbi:S9C family peptidase [Gaertneriomyces semiglobifer]|nr:S9C family peptidase [Gaertneriomyces semiglobifer]
MTVNAVVADVNPRPLQITDLVQFTRIANPVPSIDGKHVIYATSQYSHDDNKTAKKSWLVRVDDGKTIELSDRVTKELVWLDGTTVGGVAGGEGDGDGQLWATNVEAALRTMSDDIKLDFHQVTHFPVEIANIKYHHESSNLAFAAEVYNDGSLEKAAEERKKEAERRDTATVYDGLFVRHWDNYVHPERRNNLFLVKLKVSADKVEVDGEAKNLMAGQQLETPVPPFGDANDYEFSPDGAEIAFTARVPKRNAAWNTNTDIYLVATDGQTKPKSITARNLGYDTRPVYSPDGKYLAWLQMTTPGYEADKNRVMLYERSTGSCEYLTKDWDRSAESLAWTTDSSKLLLTAQDEGHVRIFSLDIQTHGLDNSAVAPADLFVMILGRKANRQITAVNQSQLDSIMMSKPEPFWFKGAEDEQVMGWIYKPTNFKAEERYPLAFLIHGGPEGAWNDGWSYRWNPQMWASAGYAVVTINFHGSTGYGSSFTESILKNWGSRPYDDLMIGLDYVLEQYGFIDADRMAALGASYGGYMINWINGHSKRFRCLVNHDGIFSTKSAYYATEELFFPEHEFAGTPYENADLYKKFDPSEFVQEWATPTLIIHGEKDYRLPVTEGLSAFTALQRRGIPSRFLYFPDENHWVLKPGNSVRWYTEVLKWLDEWVGEAARTNHLVNQQ